MKAHSLEREAEFKRIYETSATDNEAAMRLGVNQSSFSAWRRKRGLVNKYRFNAIAAKERRGTRMSISLHRQVVYYCDRIQVSLSHIHRSLDGDPRAQLAAESIMHDLWALQETLGITNEQVEDDSTTETGNAS